MIYSTIVDKTKVNRIINCKDRVFVIVSFILGLIFSKAEIAGDDASIISGMGESTIIDAFRIEYNLWYTWSSRILVNSISRSMMILPKYVWIVYCMISMYVLLKALSLLFFPKEREYEKLLITFLVLLMPWT